jgi:hypothetical protein
MKRKDTMLVAFQQGNESFFDGKKTRQSGRPGSTKNTVGLPSQRFVFKPNNLSTAVTLENFWDKFRLAWRMTKRERLLDFRARKSDRPDELLPSRSLRYRNQDSSSGTVFLRVQKAARIVVAARATRVVAEIASPIANDLGS